MVLLTLHLLTSLAAQCTDAHCLQCPASTEQCIRCSDGFAPDFRGTCTPCTGGRTGENCEYLTCGTASVRYCKTCSGNSCTECQANYQLSGGSCAPCPDDSIGMNCMDRLCNNKVFRNCKACLDGKSECASCNTNFYLTTTGCKPCTGSFSGENCTVLYCNSLYSYQYCNKCGGLTSEYCAECFPGYYWGGAFNRHCVPCAAPYTGINCADLVCESNGNKAILPYCTECNKDTLTCTICKNDYYLREDNKCIPCPNGRTGINCRSIKCYGVSRDYCAKCSNTALSNYCMECQDDYRLDGAGCVPCPTNYVGYECMTLMCDGTPQDYCTSCSATNSGMCAACKEGYYLDGGSCLVCPINCRTCSSQYSCQTCLDGHSGTICEHATCSGTLLMGCIRCSRTGRAICEACADDYYLSSNVCVKYPDCYVSNCVQCFASNPGICNVCSEGHYLKEGKCPPCTAITGCQTCTNTGQCTACMESAITLQAADSVTCVLCSSFVANCASCTSEGICLQCADGSILVDGICIPCPANCKRCFKRDFCHECKDHNYRTAEGSCSPCPVNCLKCSTPETCGVCVPGYRMEDLKCYRCPDNCKTCDAENRCTECLPGSFMADKLAGICSPCIDNCILCSNTTVCEKCMRGYSSFTGSGACIKCTNNCDSCKGEKDTDCLQAAKGYYLNALTSRVMQCVPHCLICEGPRTCFKPQRGYYFNTLTSFMTTCPQGCTGCAVLKSTASHDNIQCTACSKGYILTPTEDTVSTCIQEPRKSIISPAASSSLALFIIMLSLIILWIVVILIVRYKEGARQHITTSLSNTETI